MKGKIRPYLSCGYSTPPCLLISSVTLIILTHFLKRNNCTLFPAPEKIPRHRIRLEIKSRPLILGTYDFLSCSSSTWIFSFLGTLHPGPLTVITPLLPSTLRNSSRLPALRLAVRISTYLSLDTSSRWRPRIYAFNHNHCGLNFRIWSLNTEFTV